MIDIHNHILPNVDDGAQNIDETLKLLKQAAQQNITGIIATPHHLHHYYNNTFDQVEVCVQKLNALEAVRDLNLIIYPGQEIRVSDQIINEIENGEIKGVNRSKYLLIEMPTNAVPHYMPSLIYKIQTKGFIPIIVHPERNKAISKDINLLYQFVSAGALSQLTASSLAGDLGRKIQNQSLQMIEHQLVHFIGSDAHHAEQRPFRLGELKKVHRLKDYQNEINEMIENNTKVIENQRITKYQPIETSHKKFWLF